MPIVLGGGISGLAAAYFLTKNQVKPIKLYEATNRIGGWLKTQNYLKDGFIFESGPRTIRPVGPKGKLTLKLMEDLQLSSYIVPITGNHPAAKNRMIYVNKKLCLLPSSLGGLFKTLPPFSRPLISAIINDIKVGRSSNSLTDETIYDFAERRFGHEVAKYAVSSMICGICAGDAREISVKFLMEDLFKKEQKYGGVVKAMLMTMFQQKSINTDENNSSELVKRCVKEKWKIYSLQGGIEVLPIALGNYLQDQNVSVDINSECQQISFTKNKVMLAVNNEKHETDQLISSLPSYRLASLVNHQHPELAEELNRIQYVDVAVVNLQFDRKNLLEQPAFGFLVPPSENLPILGVIYDSCCFDMAENTVLTVMMGGKWFVEKFGLNPTPEELLSIAKQQVANILGINDEPQKSQVNVHRKCIPQYVVGHSDRIRRIRTYVTKNNLPLYLCGASYDGVGVNDVIYSSKQAVASANQ